MRTCETNLINPRLTAIVPTMTARYEHGRTVVPRGLATRNETSELADLLQFEGRMPCVVDVVVTMKALSWSAMANAETDTDAK